MSQFYMYLVLVAALSGCITYKQSERSVSAEGCVEKVEWPDNKRGKYTYREYLSEKDLKAIQEMPGATPARGVREHHDQRTDKPSSPE